MARCLAILPLLALFLLPLPAAAEGAPGGVTDTDVVVRVNGTDITVGEVAAEVQHLLPATFFHNRVDPDKVKQLQGQAVESLIAKELKLQEAKRLGITVPEAEIEARLDEAIAKFPSREAFDERLKKGGITRDSVKAEIRRRKLIARVEAQAVAGIEVGEKEARAFYDANPARFVEPEQLHLKEILLKVAPLATQEDAKVVKAKGDWLVKQLRTGAMTFDDAVAQHSEENKENGGDLGWLHKGQLSEEIEAEVVKLKLGEVAGPFKVFKGYYILQLIDRKPPRTAPFEEVRDKLIRQLQERREEAQRKAWLDGLREKAKVEILMPEALATTETGAAKGE